MNAQSETNTRLQGKWLLIARLMWAIGFITLTAMYALGFMEVREALSTVCEEEPCTLMKQIQHTDAGEQVKSWNGAGDGFADPLRPDQVRALKTLGLTLNQYGWLGALQMGIPALVFLLIAAGLFWRKADNWVALFVSVVVATTPLWAMPLPFTLAVRQPAWEWVVGLAFFVSMNTNLISPMIFPTGRFVPRWTRWTLIFFLVGSVYVLFYRPFVEHPNAQEFVAVFILISSSIGLYAMFYRYFRVASPLERQQLKWIVVGQVGFYLTFFLVLLPLNELLTSRAGSMDPARALILSAILDTLAQAITFFFPVSIVISVVRYRLWDVDILINRALVYGALTASVVGLYVLIVGWASIGLQTQNNLAGSVLGILAIAFLFRPLRRRLQEIADRFVPVPQSAWPLERHQDKIAISQGTADTTLRGRWLLTARLAWITAFIALIAMYAFGFLAVRDVLSTVCEEERCTLKQQARHTEAGDKVIGWSGPNIGYADRFRPDQVEALEPLGLTLDQYGLLGALQMGIPVLVYLLIAAGLFWWKSDDWMVLLVSAMVMMLPLGYMPLLFTLVVRQPTWEWITYQAGAVTIASLLIFPLVFPNGQFVPRWTRWKVLFDTAFIVISNSILPKPPGADDFRYAYAFLSFCISTYALSYRYFRVASPIERQQIKWVVAGLVGVLITVPLDILLVFRPVIIDSARALVLSTIPDTLFHALALFMPISIAISVLRYRLWDIDIIINRTLVYGALTGIIVIAFVIIVGFLGILAQSSGNSIIAILATGLVALLFNPLRQRLQRSVNRLMYGERDDPYAVLSGLGQRLEAAYAPESVLPTIIETVAQTLKLPYVAIALNQDGEFKIAAEFGLSKSEGVNLPLIYQGEPVGELILTPRAPGEHFTGSERQLLDDLARQAGVAAHAVRLTADLQRSRERLVLAREEERRRLRRDLHDDLAPTLASLGLTASTAVDMISTNPTTATKLVKELQTEIRATVGNIRRLVYDLRPPTLDELGLLAAVRERAAQYSNAPDGFHVTVDAPAELPALPAAVEVAAYRIVQEALENVSKHSQARNSSIRFANHKGLEIEITDDGIGLPPNITPGVGLRSMRERAEELGGSCVIEPCMNGGTRILARLPFGEFDGTLTRPDRG